MLPLHLLLQHCLAAPCAGAFVATGEGGAGLGSGQAISTSVSWTHVGTGATIRIGREILFSRMRDFLVMF